MKFVADENLSRSTLLLPYDMERTVLMPSLHAVLYGRCRVSCPPVLSVAERSPGPAGSSFAMRYLAWVAGFFEFGAFSGWSWRTALYCWRNGMNASHPNRGVRVRDVHFTEDRLAVDLADGPFGLVPTPARCDDGAAFPVDGGGGRVRDTLAGLGRGFEHRGPDRSRRVAS